jgi:hypothetical protein
MINSEHTSHITAIEQVEHQLCKMVIDGEISSYKLNSVTDNSIDCTIALIAPIKFIDIKINVESKND